VWVEGCGELLPRLLLLLLPLGLGTTPLLTLRFFHSLSLQARAPWL